MRIALYELLCAPYGSNFGLKRHRDILVKLEWGSYGIHSNRVSDRDVARKKILFAKEYRKYF